MTSSRFSETEEEVCSNRVKITKQLFFKCAGGPRGELSRRHDSRHGRKVPFLAGLISSIFYVTLSLAAILSIDATKHKRTRP